VLSIGNNIDDLETKMASVVEAIFVYL